MFCFLFLKAFVLKKEGKDLSQVIKVMECEKKLLLFFR